MMRLHVLTALLFAATAVYSQLDAPMGSICGTVQNENGEPASLVKIVAIYMGAHSGPYPSGRTDAAGHYCVVNVAPGDYVMSAADPEKGYPQMGSIFYSLRRPNQEIHIAIGNLKQHADWRIPYKAGFLEVTLTDSRTGKPIVPMNFNLLVQSNLEHGFMRGSTMSTEPLLVPPNENIYFTVSAPGYGEWPGDGTKGKLLNLLSGRTEKFAIGLQPLNQ
jgi:hypothetical protein